MGFELVRQLLGRCDGAFLLNLKIERVWQRDDANHTETASDIADCIVSVCNRVRLHSKLGNMPPNGFGQKSATTEPSGVCAIT
jgi:putative transposase